MTNDEQQTGGGEIMTHPNHFIYDVFNLRSSATHAVDVELRDRECNRRDFTIPCPEFVDHADIEQAVIWYVKSMGFIYPCKFY